MRKTKPLDRYNVSEAIRRGREAAAIMESAIFQEVLDRARERFYEHWLASQEQVDQYAAWAKTHALEAVEGELRAIVADGEVAARSVDEDL